MMTERIKLTKRDVAPILRRTFPNYKGRKFTLVLTDHVSLQDTNWSGGSKNDYVFVRIDGATAPIDTTAIPPWANPYEGQVVYLTSDIVCVEHCRFCGKDLGICIYVTPEAANRALPSIRLALPAPAQTAIET